MKLGTDETSGCSSVTASGLETASAVMDIVQDARLSSNTVVVSSNDRLSSYPRFKTSKPYNRMLQQVQHEAFSDQTVFTTRLHSGIAKDWLGDHVVHGDVVLPGAALLEIVCAAALSVAHKSTSVSADAVFCEGFSILSPVVVATDLKGDNSKLTTLSTVTTSSDDVVTIYGIDQDGSEREV
eukprot:gene15607-19938_t